MRSSIYLAFTMIDHQMFFFGAKISIQIRGAIWIYKCGVFFLGKSNTQITTAVNIRLVDISADSVEKIGHRMAQAKHFFF